MEILRILPICFTLLVLSSARPQFNFFGGGNNNGGNNGQLANTLAIAGIAGAGIFAGKNAIDGNNRLAVRPQFGVNYDPQTGGLAPVFGAAVQVGNGPASPTLNVGAQVDDRGIAPVLGAGVSAGENTGGLNANFNTGYVIRDGQTNPVFGVGANAGSFDAGQLPFGRKRRSIYYQRY